MANSGLADCSHSTLYPRAGGAGSTRTNSPLDEATSSLTHKEILASNLIKDLKEETLREDSNPAVSTMNMRKCSRRVRRTDSGARLPGLDSQINHMTSVCLEQSSYTLISKRWVMIL